MSKNIALWGMTDSVGSPSASLVDNIAKHPEAIINDDSCGDLSSIKLPPQFGTLETIIQSRIVNSHNKISGMFDDVERNFERLSLEVSALAEPDAEAYFSELSTISADVKDMLNFVCDEKMDAAVFCKNIPVGVGTIGSIVRTILDKFNSEVRYFSADVSSSGISSTSPDPEKGRLLFGRFVSPKLLVQNIDEAAKSEFTNFAAPPEQLGSYMRARLRDSLDNIAYELVNLTKFANARYKGGDLSVEDRKKWMTSVVDSMTALGTLVGSVERFGWALDRVANAIIYYNGYNYGKR